MPRVTDIAMMDKDEQPVLFIRTQTPVEALPGLIGEGYGKILALMGETGALMADAPYVGYHNMEMENLDVEIGIPVRTALAGRGDVQAGKLPAGRRVCCTHRGPYTAMEQTYEEMGAYLEKNQLKPAGMMWESYLNGPGVTEDEYLTQIVMPVE